MTGPFRAVIWDIDGVLIDSEPLHLSNFIAVSARYGYTFDATDNARWLGKSFVDMWENIPQLRSFGLTFDELINEIIDRYVDRVHSGMARSPAPGTVARLAAHGVPQAAASSSPRRIVDANIAAVGADAHLSAAFAREDVADGKPAPDLYLAAARHLGLAPADCLAIEDTESGVAAGKAAGLTVIAWPNEMTAAMDFSRADFVVDDLNSFDWASLTHA